MKADLLNRVKELAKDEQAFIQLAQIIGQIQSQNETTSLHLELLESVIRNDYDSIIITDLSLANPGPKIVYVNDGFTQLTGFSKEEAIGNTPRILQGPKTDKTTLDRLKTSLLEGKSFFGQAVNYKKDGSEFINQWDIHPLYNKAGEMTHWVSFQHDITKRKSAEAIFNETEIEFDSLEEYSKRTLVDIDLKGNILQTNNAFRALTGFDKAELTNHVFSDFIGENDVNIFLDLLKNPSKSSKLTFHLKTKQHDLIQVEIENEIHSLKSIEFIRLIIQNVSMQKNVLKTLQDRLFKGNPVAQKNNEFSFELAFDAKQSPYFTYLSKCFEIVTGFSKNDFLNNDGWEKLIHQAELKKASKHLEKVISGIDGVEELTITSAKGDNLKVLIYSQLDLAAKKLGKIRITGSIVKADINQMA